MRQNVYGRTESDAFKGRALSTAINPNMAVFGLFGQYVLPRGGVIWLGSLIQAMAVWGFSEAAARSAILRLKQTGAIEGQRGGRRTFCSLTEAGMHRLDMGGFRFSFSPTRAWDGQWTVVIYSIPEERRELRDALRDSLRWWGFGLLAPGTWVSARPLLPEMEQSWREMGVWDYMDVFRSAYVGSGDPPAMVARAFPEVPTLAADYREYIAQSEQALRRLEASRLEDRACFAIRLENLWGFYAVASEDPVLPPDLLPEDWPCLEAEELSVKIQRALAEPAERFFETIYETIGSRGHLS
jgi:phenylacetic acid degradation operon negative regulatory protein